MSAFGAGVPSPCIIARSALPAGTVFPKALITPCEQCAPWNTHLRGHPESRSLTLRVERGCSTARLGESSYDFSDSLSEKGVARLTSTFAHFTDLGHPVTTRELPCCGRMDDCVAFLCCWRLETGVVGLRATRANCSTRATEPSHGANSLVG